MKRTISLIESIIRTRSTLSQHHFHSISPLSSIISRSHRLYQPPISAPFTTDTQPKPQITKQGPSPISEDLIHRDRPVARDPITPNPPQPRDKLWKVIGLGSTVPLGLGIYWYLDKLGSTKNIGKEIGMNYIGSKQEFKQEEEVLHKLVEAMPFSTNIYELSHYSFYLGLFLAFTYFKKQPAHFGPSLAFFFILFSFVGLLFSNISSNLANYSALNAKAAFFYQISGTWSNHEGSILLWCLILSFYGFLFCLPRSPR